MPSASSSRSSKPKPAEVAAKTKKFLKEDREARSWPARALLYAQPLAISHMHFPSRPVMSLAPPVFCKSPNEPKPESLGPLGQPYASVPVRCSTTWSH